MPGRSISRRSLLRGMSILVTGAFAAACQPKVVEKRVEKEVTRVIEKEVEKVVRESVEIEKEVTRVVDPVAAAQQITLRLGRSAGATRVFFDTWSKKFEEAYPDVTVEVEEVIYDELPTKCLALGATGTLWDVFEGHNKWKPFLAYKGILLAMDDYIESIDIAYDDIFECIVSDARRVGTEGKLMWLPTGCHPGIPCIGINLDLLEEADLQLPEGAEQGNWSIDDFEQLIRAGAIPHEVFGTNLYSPGAPHNVGAWSRNWGTDPDRGSPDAWVLAPDHITNQLDDEYPLVKASMEWYWRLLQDGIAPTASEVAALQGTTHWLAGRQLSTIEAISAPGRHRAQIGDSFRHMWVPTCTGPSGHHGSSVSYNTCSCSATTKHPVESFRLAAMVTGPEASLWNGTDGPGQCFPRRSSWFHPKLWSEPTYGKLMEFWAHRWQMGLDPFPQPMNMRWEEYNDTMLQNTAEYFQAKENWDLMIGRTAPLLQGVLNKPAP